MNPEQNNIEWIIRKRRSNFCFDDKRDVEQSMLIALFEAARWAPSGGNGQPWRYILFDRHCSDSLNLARSCLSVKNQIWANAAPVLILSIAKEIRPDGKRYLKALHDLGMANQNLLLQATAMGLSCHPMGGFDAEKTIQYFGIPDGYTPVVIIAIGYAGDILSFPSDIRDKENQPRTRNNLPDFVFHGNWLNSLPQ